VLVEGEVSIEISEARRDGRGRTGQEILEALMAFESFKTSKALKLKSSKADWPPEAIHESCDVQQDLERKRQA
jgi:hypothetical protein